jgi:hypothetical protein
MRRLSSVLKGLGALVLVVSAGLIAADARATPVTYTMDLHADFVDIVSFPCSDLPPLIGGFWACNFIPPPKTGDDFFGHFTVDDSILSGADGEVDAEVTHFFLQIGALIWSQDRPGAGGGPDICGPEPFACNFVFGRLSALHDSSDFSRTRLGFTLQDHEIVGIVGSALNFHDCPCVEAGPLSIYGSPPCSPCTSIETRGFLSQSCRLPRQRLFSS